jgi:hypothetical protein
MEEFPQSGLDSSFHALKMQAAQKVYDQENYQNDPKAYTGATADSPTAVAVITASAAKKKDQKND